MAANILPLAGEPHSVDSHTAQNEAATATLGAAAIAAELGKLGTSPKGLSADEAKSRLEKYRPQRDRGP